MNMILLTLSISFVVPSDNWPGFLGAGADKVDPATIPVKWSPDSNLAWHAEIKGHGQSSPVIWGDKIFLTSVDGPNKEKVIVCCYSIKDGKLVWEKTSDSTYPEKNSVLVSRAAPTPVVDANGVYTYFESGDVMAFDHDGNPKWERSLAKDYGNPKNRFGLSASPVQTEKHIIILIDDEGPSYLIALDKESGAVVWKSDRTSRNSWSSPAMITIDGMEQVVCSSGGSIDGYDPKDGKLLWSFTDIGGNNNTTPLSYSDGEFLVAASPGVRGENTEMARISNGLFAVTKNGDEWKVEKKWYNDEAVPSWGSPIIHKGNAYWVNRQGVVFCMDAKTGESHYQERTSQSCWATPVGLGDYIYLFGKDGVTTVLKAGNEFEVVAENRVWDKDNPPKDDTLSNDNETDPQRRAANQRFSGIIQYGVAIVDGHLIIRTGTMLYCVKNEG